MTPDTLDKGRCASCGEDADERIRKQCVSCWLNRFEDSFNALADLCEHRNRIAGWYDRPREMGDSVALLHSEISEMYEGTREKPGPVSLWETPSKVFDPIQPINPIRGFNASLKLGVYGYNCVEEELADLLIRVLDETRRRQLKVAEAVGPKLTYNALRSYKHGGKTV